MKVIVIFDKTGNVLGTVPCEDDVKTARCMAVDMPRGMEVDGVLLENPRKPQVTWHDPMTEEERKRAALLEDIANKVRSGVSLRDLIGSMDLSSTEKWQLEEEVKSYGI